MVDDSKQQSGKQPKDNTFVSGKNLSNPSSRQSFLENQRTQKVSGGINRPLIGNEQLPSQTTSSSTSIPASSQDNVINQAVVKTTEKQPTDSLGQPISKVPTPLGKSFVNQATSQTPFQTAVNEYSKTYKMPDLNMNRNNFGTSIIKQSYPTQPNEERQRPQSFITANKPDIEPVDDYKLPVYERLKYNINRNYEETLKSQDITKYPEAIGKQVFIGTIATGVGIVTFPYQTVKFGYDVLSKPGEVIEGIIETPKILRQGLMNSPGETIGTVGSMFIAPELFAKVPGLISDDIRTFGKTKLPSKDIIAPEYFEGQNYPQISKGETAGELLGEFRPRLPGQTEKSSFHASPKPISKEVLPSESELPGLYVAPDLSPKFLGVTKNERPVFSLNPFETLRPTATNLIGDFELPKGVEYGSKVNPKNLPKLREFFESEAKPGTAYVTFIKGEKEAIFTPGTKFESLSTRYYFDFEGRKIPIKEYKALTGSTKGKKIVTYEDIISSSRDIGSSPRYSLFDLPKMNLGLSSSYKSSSKSYNIPSLKYSSPSSSYISKTSYYPKVSISGTKSSSYSNIGSFKSFSISPSISSSKLTSDISYPSISTGSYGSIGKSKYSLYPSKSTYSSLDIPPYPSIDSSSKGYGKKKKKKRFRKNKVFDVAPSFTAQAFDITGAFPKSGIYGISPFNIRALPKKMKGFM